MLPKMAKQPLVKLLEDLNYLYVYHRPPLASVCLTTAGALTRAAVFVIPVTPSADGFIYGLESRIYCSAACNLSLTIDYCTTYAYNSGAPWTNIVDHTGAHAVVVGGAGLVTQVDTAAIPANATALRLTVSVDTGNATPHHLLAYPSPDAPTVATYPSGFVLFDDGLLASGQHAPITTEHLNRCRVSPDAIRRDRWQNLFSWCQEEVQANCRGVLDNLADATHFPRIRCYLPGQAVAANGSVTVTVKAIVTTDDTTQTGSAVLIQDVVSGAGVYFNAETTTGTITVQSATMSVAPQGQGLMRYVDLELSGLTAAGKKTYIHAVMVFWRPGD
jgi:hypothetical protein